MDLPDHWQKWLGTLTIEDISEPNFFILTTAISKAPEILDHENIALIEELRRFYFALLMTLPYIGHPSGRMMTGAHHDQIIDVREVRGVERVFWPAG